MGKSSRAVWQGNFIEGKGQLNIENSELNKVTIKPFFAKSDGSFTNPEELLAAAHAGCFTMALSLVLGESKLKADSLDTTCTITIEKDGEGFSITRSHLELKAKVPGASQEVFDNAVQAAKTNCPVSKLFDTEITLSAKLEH